MLKKCLICTHNKTVLENNCLGTSYICFCEKKHNKEFSLMNGCTEDFQEAMIECVYCRKQILVSKSFKGFCSNECFEGYKDKTIKILDQDKEMVKSLKIKLALKMYNNDKEKILLKKDIAQLEKDITQEKYILNNIKLKEFI